jgi:hypothetical protein
MAGKLKQQTKNNNERTRVPSPDGGEQPALRKGYVWLAWLLMLAFSWLR